MNVEFTPDPEFVERLEWELSTTMRRRASSHGTGYAPRPAGRRLGAALGLVVVSMLIGGAGTHAVTHRIDKQAAELAIARSEALLEIAQIQIKPFAQDLSRTQSLFERGAVGQHELRQIEARFIRAETDATLRELELKEVLMTGKAPNDALSAPLAGNRDFVTERMTARLRPMKRRLELVVSQVQRLEALSDTDSVPLRELRAARAEIVGPEADLDEMAARLALRAAYLANEMSATEVELQGMRLAAMKARRLAMSQVEVLVEQRGSYAALFEQGHASDAELRAVEAELQVIEARIELADLELRILDEKLADVANK